MNEHSRRAKLEQNYGQSLPRDNASQDEVQTVAYAVDILRDRHVLKPPIKRFVVNIVTEELAEPPADEGAHLVKCEACGGWIDCRDLGSVFDHEGRCRTPPPTSHNE